MDSGLSRTNERTIQIRSVSQGAFSHSRLSGGKTRSNKGVAAGVGRPKTSLYPLRVLFLSRRSFAEWEHETLLLDGRFGRQEIAALSPLNVDDGVKLIEEAARNFAAHAHTATPDFRDGAGWKRRRDTDDFLFMRRRPRFMRFLSPQEAFGFGEADLLKDLALREIRRVQETSTALGLGQGGLSAF